MPMWLFISGCTVYKLSTH